MGMAVPSIKISGTAIIRTIRPRKKNYLFIIPARADFSARPPSFYSLCACATAGQRASKTTAMPVVELVQSTWYASTLHRWLMF